MKIEAISVYGSAGTFSATVAPKAIVTAHVVVDGCDTVEKAKALLRASAEMQAALEFFVEYKGTSDDDLTIVPHFLRSMEIARAALEESKREIPR